ncbi:TPA: DDE-type integrase/transposase/recombinase [Bacillus cereus]|nr:DDE-type integrase/transposase/recombinase [Bacillus cereus]
MNCTQKTLKILRICVEFIGTFLNWTNESDFTLNRQKTPVDSKENTSDFYLSKKRNQKALRSLYVLNLRVITVDKNSAYPIAIEELKEENKMSESIQIRKVEYLNNIMEQNYRFIKKCVCFILRFKSMLEHMVGRKINTLLPSRRSRQ